MLDANTQALSQHLEKQDKQSKALETLLDSLQDKFEEIEKIKTECLQIANDYQGFNFSDDVIQEIRELVWWVKHSTKRNSYPTAN